MESFYAANKNQTGKLLAQIKENFSKQAVPFRANNQPPEWMIKLGKKRCEQCASGFYAIAMEMSRENKAWMSIGGKRMTLKEVSQRAMDYATAAVACEKKQASYQAKAPKKDTGDSNMDELNSFINQADPSSTDSSQSSAYHSYNPEEETQRQDSSWYEMTSNKASFQELNAGWADALDKMGLSGFSDVTKNMGYVLAMLPDMMIDFS